ncbi:MAG: DUF4124 domain-containing protein [Gammaproteobacteria bacterium]|nr:DUF4124 domain-containing protein [Gammaproteobacteria bacterium]
MPKRSIITLIATLAAGAVLAQAYKWTDEDGIVHYSDRPQEGAERVQLVSDGRRPRPAPPPVARAGSGAADEAADETPVFGYESLTIGAPLAEETLWNIAGVLNVTLNVQPALQSGHRIRVYFDGTPRIVTRTSFEIDEVWRGVHNIQAEIIDESGTMMIRSMPSRFYVQQNVISRRPGN